MQMRETVVRQTTIVTHLLILGLSAFLKTSINCRKQVFRIATQQESVRGTFYYFATATGL